MKVCPLWCNNEVSRAVKGGQVKGSFVLWETFVMSNKKVVTTYFSKLNISPEAFYYLTFVVVLKLELPLPVFLSLFKSWHISNQGHVSLT